MPEVMKFFHHCEMCSFMHRAHDINWRATVPNAYLCSHVVCVCVCVCVCVNVIALNTLQGATKTHSNKNCNFSDQIDYLQGVYALLVYMLWNVDLNTVEIEIQNEVQSTVRFLDFASQQFMNCIHAFYI